MWNCPFDESMLDDPRGVLVLCTCVDDAIALEKVLIDHGITDWPGTLEERYNTILKDHPNEEACFNIRDRRVVEDVSDFDSSVEYCYRSFYEREGEYFGSQIKCTFYGTEQSNFEVADDTELLALFGIGGG